jgi:hypothetical protein
VETGNCYLTLDAQPEKTFPVRVESISYGIAQLSLEGDSAKLFKSFGQPLSIQVRREDELFINGSWILEDAAERDGRLYISLAHQRCAELAAFKEYILPENLLVTNRYRLISAENSSESDTFTRHLAEIKDCPIPISARISTLASASKSASRNTMNCNFDFSSGARELTTLDFSFDGANIELELNEKIKVDYEFLGARFTFTTTISSIDSDFGIITVDLPTAILSLTTRAFDRTDADIDALVTADSGSKTPCKIKSFSAKGAELHLESGTLGSKAFPVGVKISLSFFGSSDICGSITNVRQNILGVSFLDEKQTLPVKRELFNGAFSKRFIIREPENYSAYLSLYDEVGYGPSNPNAKMDWETQSSSVWRKQDALLSGNTAAFGTAERLLGCASALPMSNNTVVIHSVGVVKELQALPKTLDLLNYCHSWLEMLSDIKTLCMCFRHMSRFMTRLHLSAETHASPESTQIFPCVGYTGKPKSTPDHDFTFREFSSRSEFQISPNFRRFYECINEVYSSLEEFQTIRQYQVFRRGDSNPCAIVVHHSAEPLFTAVDTFRTAFCLILDSSSDLTKIVDAIGSNPTFSDHEVCTFIDNVDNHDQFSYSGEMSSTPLYLYLLAKSDFGPLLASMHRFIYKTMRKYGDESLDYLQKVVSA